jgi:hypothetical protein
VSCAAGSVDAEAGKTVEIGPVDSLIEERLGKPM